MTTEQLPLPLAELVEPEYDAHATIADRFTEFHAANPHVADLLERLADQWLSAGHQRVGVKRARNAACTDRWHLTPDPRTLADLAAPGTETARRIIAILESGTPREGKRVAS